MIRCDDKAAARRKMDGAKQRDLRGLALKHAAIGARLP